MLKNVNLHLRASTLIRWETADDIWGTADHDIIQVGTGGQRLNIFAPHGHGEPIYFAIREAVITLQADED